ncbi:hypothetical protein [Streptomyces sp. NPDC015125]|uniref:hypothetical protein n=1 Tax=Streptomyces sp. NPDC015125 TaxID=3364938 RepID=UPI0037006530
MESNIEVNRGGRSSTRAVTVSLRAVLDSFDISFDIFDGGLGHCCVARPVVEGWVAGPGQDTRPRRYAT